MNFFEVFFARPSIRIGLRVLLVIVATEAMIMTLFHVTGIQAADFHTGLIDTLVLAIVASVVIYRWVIRPLNRARQQDDLFNTLVDNLDVGVVVTDSHLPDNPVIYVNQAFERITGYSMREMLGKNPRLLHHEEIDTSALMQAKQAVAEGNSIRVTLKNRRKDGSVFWNDLHLNPIVNEFGKGRFWVGLINDVTVARNMERENNRWASALRQSDEAVCIFAGNGVIEYANSAFSRNVGVSQELLNNSSMDRFWDKGSDSYHAFCHSLLLHTSWAGRHTRYRADGSSYEALTSVTPIHDMDGRISFVSVHRDISDLVLMEAQLRQSQKMEAVGLLVSGIAHDFNNVLAGILGNLYMLKQQMQVDSKEYKRIGVLEEQGFSAAGMIRQLLSFARKAESKSRCIDLVSFIKELVKFAKVSVPENIKLKLELNQKKLSIQCDPVQLQQSLLNIIVNAVHAVQETGRGDGEIMVSVAISDAPVVQDGAHDFRELGQHDAWVRISIRDNGVGMDSDAVKNIFDPFYTTKPVGIGTGLGLAMVNSYIQSLHGVINVQSSVGEGSRFDIYLPKSSDDASEAGHVSAKVRQGNGELILVADDDAMVRVAMVEMLEAANYRVLEAGDGTEAYEMFRQHAKELNMAFLDVVMPGVSGVRLAEQMKQAGSDLPVVLMTAYDRTPALSSTGGAGLPMLSKPWAIDQLNEMLECSLV